MADNGHPATSVEMLDVHLDYLRRDVAKLVEAVSTMATKADIEHLAGRLDSYATKEELRALESRIEADSVPSTLDRWFSWIQKVGAAAAVLGGGALLIAEFVARMKL